MKDDVLISIFSLLQKQLFREWGTWIYEVGFLISDEERHHRYFFMLEEYRVGVLAFPDFLRYSIIQ